MKTVFILTYININNDEKREIFGVYADENSAINAMNDELLLPLREYFDDEEQLLCTIDPDIQEHNIIKRNI